MKRPRVIVIGGGVSGSTAALKAAEAGAEVLLFARTAPRRSLSCLEIGGLNAALDTKGESDSPSAHARDAILCGDFLANQGRVEAMCEGAPAIARLFDRMGAAFARTPEGLPDLVRLAGSSCRRSLYSHAGVGAQLANVLYAQLRRRVSSGKVRLFEGWEFLSLVLDEKGLCRGVVAANRSNMEIKPFAAEAVVLCSGGFEGLWGRMSTKPAADGAGIAVCYEQGALLANPEFVQFSAFAVSGEDSCHPVCAFMQAFGARIQVPRESAAWRFLEEWHPASCGLVPDDVAARAFHKMVAETGHGVDAVQADFSGIDDGIWSPSLVGRLDLFGRITGEDPRKVSVKVSPAASMTLGGLWVDSSHATSVGGLFAAGSASCGYHGACALAGDELLSSSWGGLVAGGSAAFFALESGRGEVSSSTLESAKAREEDANVKFAQQQGDENAHAIMRELSSLLSSSAFVARDNKSLSAASEKISELKERFERAQLADRGEWANLELFSMRSIGRAFALSQAVVAASLARDESRGVFFKPEFPERDDVRWLATTRVEWTESGPTLDHKERVDAKAFAPEVRKYE